MREAVAGFVRQALPANWTCRAGHGEPPHWLIVAPDGQVRSLMGLHRLTRLQIENRVKGLIQRVHLGARVRASEVGHRDPRNGPQESDRWSPSVRQHRHPQPE